MENKTTMVGLHRDGFSFIPSNGKKPTVSFKEKSKHLTLKEAGERLNKEVGYN